MVPFNYIIEPNTNLYLKAHLKSKNNRVDESIRKYLKDINGPDSTWGNDVFNIMRETCQKLDFEDVTRYFEIAYTKSNVYQADINNMETKEMVDMELMYVYLRLKQIYINSDIMDSNKNKNIMDVLYHMSIQKDSIFEIGFNFPIKNNHLVNFKILNGKVILCTKLDKNNVDARTFELINRMVELLNEHFKKWENNEQQ